MNFFSQRRLGQRLAWGFGTVLALLLGIAALSLIGMQNLNRTLQDAPQAAGAMWTTGIFGELFCLGNQLLFRLSGLLPGILLQLF